MIRFASLGSGSRGNSLIVDAGDTKLLVDCGFSTSTMLDRLAHLSISPEQIAGVLVTHEHSDHVAGVFRFAGRFGLPVYLTHGTLLALSSDCRLSLPQCLLFDSHNPFQIGSLEVLPFPVPHDAREPVQFVFSSGLQRLGILTDCGSITQHVVDMLSACDALVLECNHDQALLAASSYPAALKRRVSGNYGHLENSQAASLIEQIDAKRLQHVVAAHLSEQNNRPALATAALARVLGCSEDWIGVACQRKGFGWRHIF